MILMMMSLSRTKKMVLMISEKLENGAITHSPISVFSPLSSYLGQQNGKHHGNVCHFSFYCTRADGGPLFPLLSSWEP